MASYVTTIAQICSVCQWRRCYDCQLCDMVGLCRLKTSSGCKTTTTYSNCHCGTSMMSFDRSETKQKKKVHTQSSFFFLVTEHESRLALCKSSFDVTRQNQFLQAK